MCELKTLQESMQNYVIDGTALPEGIEGQAQVYRDAYYARLISILADDYQLLEKMLGEEDFKSLVMGYLQAYPPQSFSVHHVDADFLQHLDEMGEDMVFIKEFAAFEKAFKDVLHATAFDPLTLDYIKQLPQEQSGECTMRLQPTVQLLSLQHNILECWEAVKTGEGEVDISINPELDHYVIWRQGLTAYYAQIDPKEAKLVILMRGEGVAFNELCSVAMTLMPEEQATSWVAACLSRWLEQELLQKVAVN